MKRPLAIFLVAFVVVIAATAYWMHWSAQPVQAGKRHLAKLSRIVSVPAGQSPVRQRMLGFRIRERLASPLEVDLKEAAVSGSHDVDEVFSAYLTVTGDGHWVKLQFERVEFLRAEGDQSWFRARLRVDSSFSGVAFPIDEEVEVELVKEEGRLRLRALRGMESSGS